MACTWNYEIQAKYEPKNVTLAAPWGGEITFTAKSPEATTAVIVRGSVSYECRNPESEIPLPNGIICNNKIFDLETTMPPTIEYGNFSDLYDIASLPTPFPGLGFDIIKPTITCHPDIRLTTMNDGACVNVLLSVQVHISKGGISYALPTLPTLPPVTPPPAEFITVQPCEDTVFLQYTLCCCSYDQDLPEVDTTKDKPYEGKGEPRSLVIGKSCGNGCAYVEHGIGNLDKNFSLLWSVEADVGACDFTTEMVQTSDRNFRTKRRAHEKKKSSQFLPAQ